MSPAPPRTFADLEPAGLELAVTCQRCRRQAVIDDASPTLRHQRIAGRRFRCMACGAIGLPSLGKRRWAARLSEHAGTRNAVEAGGSQPSRRKGDRQ